MRKPDHKKITKEYEQGTLYAVSTLTHTTTGTESVHTSSHDLSESNAPKNIALAHGDSQHRWDTDRLLYSQHLTSHYNSYVY